MRWAREHDVLVAVRGGGHNVAGTGTCDDGLVIDLLPMKGVRVEPASGTVRCQAGLAWADLDYETQTFGLATTGGLVSSTGVSGFTLGGGIGWLQRAVAWLADNVPAARGRTAGDRRSGGVPVRASGRSAAGLAFRGRRAARGGAPDAARLTGSGSAGRPGTAPLLAGSLMREERDRTGHASASAAP